MTADYASGRANNGANKGGLNNPAGIAIDTVNHRFFVSDNGNNRVLVYNLDASNNLLDRLPDNVLGQADFSSSTLATTQSGMYYPDGLAYDAVNNRLFVVDGGNSRVLVYDVTVIANGENAINVLGQSDFTSAGASVSQSGMNAPSGIAHDAANNRLFVVDQAANRTLVFDVAAITDGENAVNVLGQTNFTNWTSATTQSRMNSPESAVYDSANQRLFVSDNGNNRVLVYDVNAITNGENAINVLGQTNFTNSSASVSQSRLSGPDALAYDAVNQRLFVTEAGNNRVLIYAVNGITNGEKAINVLGQTNFTNNNWGTSQSEMYIPRGAAYDSTNDRIYIGDFSNHRVMIFGGVQPSPGVAAPALFFGGF